MESLASQKANEVVDSVPERAVEGRCWFAATTQPHRERVAVDNLVRQGFHTFCPLERVVRHHARKTIAMTVPVFRGYVFVHMDPGKARWRSINGTLGVRSLVTNGDVPLPIRPGVIETLAASTDADGILKFANPLQPGMTVRLRAGPLAEQLGVIERLDGSGRLVLLLDFMGGRVRTGVSRDMILKVA
ncbi:transcription termination/antitermination protein NusG [Pleomorphomonas koreensis]|uniref:transcription termination/antitermination protein NusG n=1 Tax=Pleomorphomonas koreensis TaxID=257440 RepID=UPI00146D6235|nr:transcriptional activator RfaH [Pleomorphomonas koreensis]